MNKILFFFLVLFLFNSCERPLPPIVDPNRPGRTLKEYFDKKYLLYKLPADYYGNKILNHSFNLTAANNPFQFLPLGYNDSLLLQYTHVYSKECIYHVSDTMWKYAEVCFPNTCLTRDSARAEVTVRNTTSQVKTFYLRLFYQNTSYWYPTDSSIDFASQNYLDNYYGASHVVEVSVPAGQSSVVSIPYNIGMNPKHEYDYGPALDPARPGNYEFMVLALPAKDNLLFDENINLKKVNPFAEVKRDELQNGGKKYFNYTAYVKPEHFKFVFVDEYFDGVNDLAPKHLYAAKDNVEKALCDTCTGWYRGIINESWTCDDFFKGFINKVPFVKAEYGNRKENCRVDNNGIMLTCPKSTRGNYKKTWGEVAFGPPFKYGHVVVRAKFDEMINKQGTPNGIVHNLWLYQLDADKVDTTNPYHHLVDANGKQRFEIDFEIWSATKYNLNTVWDPYALINYSIVDYMRDAYVQLKPGEEKKFGGYTLERFNQRQASRIGGEMPGDFFKQWHVYEIYWFPDHVLFFVDGTETANIPNTAAKIPDKSLFLWIGSPMYQDGTYYTASYIPFLENDKRSLIDYIRIE